MLRGWLKVNHPNPLKGISRRAQLMKARDRRPIQRGIKERRHGTRPMGPSLKLIPTSRSLVVIYKATSLISDQDPHKSSQGLWRNWNGILAQCKSIAAIQTSWPPHWRHSLTRRCQTSSQTLTLIIPRLMYKWTTSKRRTLMRPSVRN